MNAQTAKVEGGDEVKLGDVFRLVVGFGETLTKHMEREEEERQEQIEQHRKMMEELSSVRSEVKIVHQIVEAFPKDKNGNPDFPGHRQDHDTRIEDSRDSQAFWRSMKEQIGKNLVNFLMLAVFLGINIYIYSVAHPAEKSQAERDAEIARVVKETMRNHEAAAKLGGGE